MKGWTWQQRTSQRTRKIILSQSRHVLDLEMSFLQRSRRPAATGRQLLSVRILTVSKTVVNQHGSISRPLYVGARRRLLFQDGRTLTLLGRVEMSRRNRRRRPV